MLRSEIGSSQSAPGVGVTIALFVDFPVRAIFCFMIIPVQSFESRSYLTSVAAIQLQRPVKNEADIQY